MNDLPGHPTILELSEPAPAELAIASDFTLKIRLACPEGCDLAGARLTVTTPDGQELTIASASADTIREITLKAPEQAGEQVWNVRFPAREHAGARHEGRSLAVVIKTKPHTTSLAVWGVPSPVVMGERFSVKVGAKSSAACALAGSRIAISDASGEVLGEGVLREAPWPGTSALYWTDVELAAPAQEGMFWCTVNFAATDIERPHDGSAAKFSVAIVRRPEHRLTVEVLERDTGAPIEDAQIRLGAYRTATDPSGRAEVALPKGSYALTVWKVGYEAPERTIDINDDVGIQIEAAIVPPENPDAPWII